MNSRLTSPNRQAIHDQYQHRVREYDDLLDANARKSTRLSQLRSAAFIASAILAIVGWSSSGVSWPWFVGAGVLFAGLIALAVVHEIVEEQSLRMIQRRKMSQTQCDRIDRQWKRIPVTAVDVLSEHQAVAADLDLFGKASLFQLTSLAHTPFGIEILRDWLLNPASREEIAIRQQAVAELAPDIGLREELDLRGRLLGANPTAAKSFVQWAEGSCWLASRRWLKWITCLLTVGVVAALAGGWFGLGEPGIVFIVLLALLGLNTLTVVIFAGPVQDIFNRVSSGNHDVQHYRHLFELIAGLPEACPFFARLHASMGETRLEPLRRLKGLTRIVGFANLRRNGLWGIPYMVFQFFVLLDFWVLAWLERWQQRHGQLARQWLAGVGQLEAISSLATLAHDHPDWVMPVVSEPGEKQMQAQSLGHPLLVDDDCVRNDVSIGPSGTFLLVTGSNMSGKSTLLRSIGVNVALAQAGAPVCAAEFRLSPLRIATSMRVHDSLADGVSFFMAELRRMKNIVDQSRDLQNSEQWTLLYLLDEILQGTNSAERQIAVARIIGNLMSNGAVGAVSTHDLGLATAPELADACETVHFRETIINEGSQRQMTFDYKMRPGLAPTTNALKLLELVGLID